MRVIVPKDGSQPTLEPGTRILAREAYEDWIATEDLLSDAREKVRRWRRRAADEYARQVEQGREAGRAAGEEERVAALLTFSRMAVAEIQALHTSLEETAAQAVREAFGMAPARKRLRVMVQRLLAETATDQAVHVSVHPEQHAVLADILGEDAFADHDLRLTHDPAVGADSVRVEASTGVLETSLERMLAGLERYRRTS